MTRLLTDEELAKQVRDITKTMFVTLSEWQAGVTIDWESAKIKGRAELVALIQSQKLAHANMVIGEDVKRGKKNNCCGYDGRISSEQIFWENNMKSKQRERNV